MSHAATPDPSPDSFRRQVEDLCCAYSATPPSILIPRCRAALTVYGLLEERRPPGDQQDIAVARGWLLLLLGCLWQDTGQADRAASVTRFAEAIGKDVGHPPVVGWAAEIRAWQANTAGRHQDAVRTARDAADRMADSTAVVQLRFQQAMGQARLGDGLGALSTLDMAERTLDRIPPPARPADHFVTDRGKLHFYATQVHDVSGYDRGVAESAAQALVVCQGPGGETPWPMRVSRIQLALAHMQVRQGEFDAAAAYGMQALSHHRMCVPTTLGRARELHAALKPARTPATRDFEAMLRSVIRERVGAG